MVTVSRDISILNFSAFELNCYLGYLIFNVKTHTSFYSMIYKLDTYLFIGRVFWWSFKHVIFSILKICCVFPQNVLLFIKQAFTYYIFNIWLLFISYSSSWAFLFKEENYSFTFTKIEFKTFSLSYFEHQNCLKKLFWKKKRPQRYIWLISIQKT